MFNCKFPFICRLLGILTVQGDSLILLRYPIMPLLLEAVRALSISLPSCLTGKNDVILIQRETICLCSCAKFWAVAHEQGFKGAEGHIRDQGQPDQVQHWSGGFRGSEEWSCSGPWEGLITWFVHFNIHIRSRLSWILRDLWEYLSRWLPIIFLLLLNLFFHSNKLSSLYCAVSWLSQDAVLNLFLSKFSWSLDWPHVPIGLL